MSTQDSVHFHSKLLNQVLGPAHNIKKTLTQMALGQEESSEDGVELKDKAELTMYQLHGDMQQKVCIICFKTVKSNFDYLDSNHLQQIIHVTCYLVVFINFRTELTPSISLPKLLLVFYYAQ